MTWLLFSICCILTVYRQVYLRTTVQTVKKRYRRNSNGDPIWDLKLQLDYEDEVRLGLACKKHGGGYTVTSRDMTGRIVRVDCRTLKEACELIANKHKRLISSAAV